MSPETPEAPPPGRFGRSTGAAARAAFWLSVLGCGAVGYLERLIVRRGTPLGDVFLATGIPPLLPLALGCLAVLATAGYGFFKSVAGTERFRVGDEGLEVEGYLGRYTLEWANVAEVGVTPGHALGVRARDRAAVMRTHAGTPEQREWLRTLQPFGDWDFLYPRADLGHPPELVATWLQSRLTADGGATASAANDAGA